MCLDQIRVLLAGEEERCLVGMGEGGLQLPGHVGDRVTTTAFGDSPGRDHGINNSFIPIESKTSLRIICLANHFWEIPCTRCEPGLCFTPSPGKGHLVGGLL